MCLGEAPRWRLEWVKLGGKGAFSTRPVMPNDRTSPVLTASWANADNNCNEVDYSTDLPSGEMGFNVHLRSSNSSGPNVGRGSESVLLRYLLKCPPWHSD